MGTKRNEFLSFILRNLQILVESSLCLDRIGDPVNECLGFVRITQFVGSDFHFDCIAVGVLQQTGLIEFYCRSAAEKLLVCEVCELAPICTTSMLRTRNKGKKRQMKREGSIGAT